MHIIVVWNVLDGGDGKAKLSFMPFLLKITSACLHKFPILNATVSEDESEMLLQSAHHIGVAVDSPQGLQVPVVRDVDRRSIFEIADELNRLQVERITAHRKRMSYF